jgi:hypothetical protein
MKKSKLDNFSAMRKSNEGRFSTVKKSKVISGFVVCSLHEVYKINMQWESCACPSVSFMSEVTQRNLMKFGIEGTSLNLSGEFILDRVG